MLKFAIVILMALGLLISCAAPPPNFPDPEPREYQISDIALAYWHPYTLKEGTKTIDYSFYLSEEGVSPLTVYINGEAETLKYSQNRYERRYYNGYKNNTYIECAVTPNTNQISRVHLRGGDYPYSEIYSQFSTEDEYLSWINALVVSYGIFDLDNFEYNCQTTFYDEMDSFVRRSGFVEDVGYGNKWSGYVFEFVRYAGDLQTDDYVMIVVGNDEFILDVSPYRFDDMMNAIIDADELYFKIEEYVPTTVNSYYVFDSISEIKEKKLTYYQKRLCVVYTFTANIIPAVEGVFDTTGGLLYSVAVFLE